MSRSVDVLDPGLRARLDALVGSGPVVLFMKGTRAAPLCGFSARTVGHLDGLLDDYVTVDVLEDDAVRDGMKAYADWPTFPQLWVRGELVGGADIVDELAQTGALAEALQVVAAAPPEVRITAAAAAHVRAVLDGADVPLRLRISAAFAYGFEEVEAPGPSDVVVSQHGLRLVFDPGSASRAEGLVLDLVGEPGAEDAQLVVDNPQEPARVRALSVGAYAGWRAEGRPHVLVDVRTPGEWRLARIEGARLLAEEPGLLDGLPKDTTLVFQCHHGVRSHAAAMRALADGFTAVFNLEGGIDAWSHEVDPSVPQY